MFIGDGILAQIIKPSAVKILSKEGEVQVSITLELNINLNTDNIKINAQSFVEDSHKKEKKTKFEEDKVEWEIPDFDFSQKIEFGKQE